MVVVNKGPGGKRSKEIDNGAARNSKEKDKKKRKIKGIENRNRNRKGLDGRDRPDETLL